LTIRPEEVPEGGAGRLNNMDQVVVQPQIVPEQLRFLADRPLTQGYLSLSALFATAYIMEPLYGKILEAI